MFYSRDRMCLICLKLSIFKWINILFIYVVLDVKWKYVGLGLDFVFSNGDFDLKDSEEWRGIVNFLVLVDGFEMVFCS